MTNNIQLLETDEVKLVQLVHELLLAPSANPPGDVSAPVRVATDFLNEFAIPYEIFEPQPGFKNVIATVEGVLEGDSSKHVVMNAHLDVFPASEAQRTDRTPEVLFGRGAVDMKGGAGAFLAVLAKLQQNKHAFSGKVTLILVCDEETFGPNGSLAVLQEYPHLEGDYLLSSEPSSLAVVRYGERGHIWATVNFPGEAGHSAYPGTLESPTERAAKFILSFRERIDEMTFEVEFDGNDNILAPEKASYVDQVSLNFGKVRGGVKVNMKPTSCNVEVDVRLPYGTAVETVLTTMQGIAKDLQAHVSVDSSGEANQSDLDNELFSTLVSAVEIERGSVPKFGIGLGCTDTRLWRFRGVPAAVFGPNPQSMASENEHIDIAELLIVARVHLRTVFTLLQNVSNAKE